MSAPKFWFILLSFVGLFQTNNKRKQQQQQQQQQAQLMTNSVGGGHVIVAPGGTAQSGNSAAGYMMVPANARASVESVPGLGIGRTIPIKEVTTIKIPQLTLLGLVQLAERPKSVSFGLKLLFNS